MNSANLLFKLTFLKKIQFTHAYVVCELTKTVLYDVFI